MALEIDITLSLEDLQKFYSNYFGYYNTLNTQYQQLFIKRCRYFISEKTIVGAEGFEPDNRVKAMIAACAVQLTLGLERWSFNYFETIIIHPSDFDDRVTGLKFRGETNLAGYIRLSWKGFIAGYKTGDDNINLGLHEFMHAIRFSSVKGDIQDYFVEHYFSKWMAAAMEAYRDVKNNRQTIFRKYGGTNINEFLSVCIEHYFESPQEIKKEYPHLYYCTAVLLNQQTQNKVTQINIRETLLLESNLVQEGFSENTLYTSLFKSPSLRILFIIAMPWLLTITEAGLFSGASMILIFLLALIYFRFDSKYTTAHFRKNEVIIRRGFFIFRNWRKHVLTVSSLISLRVYNNSGNDNEWEVTFYDPKKEAFYEETIATNDAIDPEFVKELVSNRIAYFKS